MTIPRVYLLNLIQQSTNKHSITICQKPHFWLHFNNSKQARNMSTDSNLLKPPEEVRNMQTLNKNMFNKEVSIPCINIDDKKVSDILPILKKYLLKLDHCKPIVNEAESKLILLNPMKIRNFDDIDENDKKLLLNKEIDSNNFNTRRQELKYENFTAEDILRSVLPSDKEGSASYTKIGHIVHINLREHLLPYKNIIGQVLLEKVSGCRTVVNKIDMIDNTYRNFKMEILAGENDFLAQLKENKCRFEFDFSTVYWNSRLCTEHERIVNFVKSTDVLFDVFAGVGPFSVPAAKKKATVFANDLNPESYKWLQHNAKINKTGKNLQMFNKDGRDFILNDVKDNLIKYIDKANVHIVMNLPALATEFLSAFSKMYDSNELGEISKPPLIYVYCFAKGEDYIGIAKNLVVKHMGYDIRDNIVDIFRVRTVSSLKEMMRVTIKLDRDILIGNKRKCEDECNEDTKRKVVMGKNKPKKNTNVFKVAGAKSLKFKSKAKVVKGQLKNIITKNIQQIDKELATLQDTVRQSSSEMDKKPITNKKKIETKKETQADFDKAQEDSKNVVKDLDTMQL